jgi:transaldolase
MKLFCDCADLEQIKIASLNPLIKGFTTNPTLMHKAGITDYENFAKETIEYLHKHRPDTCISLEVFADDINEMENQAQIIHSWSYNYPVYVKIPVTNTSRQSTNKIIKNLTDSGVKVNVTAVFNYFQTLNIYDHLNAETPSIISIFSGRIADTGIEAGYHFNNIIDGFIKKPVKNVEFLWASPRQAYDYTLAKLSGADIITMTPELISKLSLIGKDLDEYSLDTVKMFYNDGQKAGFKI